MDRDQLMSQVKYALEKAGHKFVQGADYAVSTPVGVARHLAEGRPKLATFEPRLGEKLVIMGPKKEV